MTTIAEYLNRTILLFSPLFQTLELNYISSYWCILLFFRLSIVRSLLTMDKSNFVWKTRHSSPTYLSRSKLEVESLAAVTWGVKLLAVLVIQPELKKNVFTFGYVHKWRISIVDHFCHSLPPTVTLFSTMACVLLAHNLWYTLPLRHDVIYGQPLTNVSTLEAMTFTIRWRLARKITL